ncbi:histidine phosphatase family protein [Patescibacteria group bacterium]
MEKLIIVRHGDDIGHKLSKDGALQILNLAKKLKSEVNHSSAIILTSPVNRVHQSAEIIAEELDAEVEKQEILRSSNEDDTQLDETLDLVNKQKSDVVILVTHWEYTQEFPMFFGSKALSVQFGFQNVKKGGTVIIDCKQKTLELIPPQA